MSILCDFDGTERGGEGGVGRNKERRGEKQASKRISIFVFSGIAIPPFIYNSPPSLFCACPVSNLGSFMALCKEGGKS